MYDVDWLSYVSCKTCVCVYMIFKCVCMKFLWYCMMCACVLYDYGMCCVRFPYVCVCVFVRAWLNILGFLYDLGMFFMMFICLYFKKNILNGFSYYVFTWSWTMCLMFLVWFIMLMMIFVFVLFWLNMFVVWFMYVCVLNGFLMFVYGFCKNVYWYSDAYCMVFVSLCMTFMCLH